MRIAIAGKGGTGKTTLSGTVARALARAGRPVLAIDADTNPNLASVLGIVAGEGELAEMPRNLMQKETVDGVTTSRFVGDTDAIIRDYATRGPDGVELLVMGKVGHAGKGCLCSAHASVRGFLGEVGSGGTERDVIVDMEAGLEHLSRGTGRHVSRVVAVLEPYYRSMETARNVVRLAGELGIDDVLVVANKVRDDGDRSAIADFCRAHGMHLIGEVPFDAGLSEAERRGVAPIDVVPTSPAVRAIEALAPRLVG